jgi:hypothetical protein
LPEIVAAFENLAAIVKRVRGLLENLPELVADSLELLLSPDFRVPMSGQSENSVVSQLMEGFYDAAKNAKMKQVN